MLDNPVERAWLAGLMLGEVTIYLWRATRHIGGRRRVDGPYPAFTIEMTELPVIERVSFLVGTSAMRVVRRARRPPRYSPTFSVRAVGARALVILKLVHPYFYGGKKVQTKKIIKDFAWVLCPSNLARLPRNLKSFYKTLIR